MNKNVQKTPWHDVNWPAIYTAWGGWILDGFTTTELNEGKYTKDAGEN